MHAPDAWEELYVWALGVVKYKGCSSRCIANGRWRQMAALIMVVFRPSRPHDQQPQQGQECPPLADGVLMAVSQH